MMANRHVDSGCNDEIRLNLYEGARTREHYLYAMVTVREIIHRLVLFVDDADAGFVGADDHRFDIIGRLSLFFQVGMD